jgi:hypothetical protein
VQSVLRREDVERQQDGAILRQALSRLGILRLVGRLEQIKKDNAPKNFGLLRRLALYLLKKDTT